MKQISNYDLYQEMQKVKKLLSILLDKESIRKSDLDNFKRERDEAAIRAQKMIDRSSAMIRTHKNS